MADCVWMPCGLRTHSALTLSRHEAIHKTKQENNVFLSRIQMHVLCVCVSLATCGYEAATTSVSVPFCAAERAVALWTRSNVNVNVRQKGKRQTNQDCNKNLNCAASVSVCVCLSVCNNNCLCFCSVYDINKQHNYLQSTIPYSERTLKSAALPV